MNKSIDSFAAAHQIFVLDAYLKTPLDCSLRTPITKSFIGDALKVLKLKAIGSMEIYASNDQRAPGWSFIQPLSTSHISAHYFANPGNGPYVRLDAYSCDSINWRELLSVCHQHFSLTQWRGTFIDRAIEFDDERVVLDIAGVGNTSTTETRLDTTRAQGPDNKLAAV